MVRRLRYGNSKVVHTLPRLNCFITYGTNRKKYVSLTSAQGVRSIDRDKNVNKSATCQLMEW